MGSVLKVMGTGWEMIVKLEWVQKLSQHIHIIHTILMMDYLKVETGKIMLLMDKHVASWRSREVFLFWRPTWNEPGGGPAQQLGCCTHLSFLTVKRSVSAWTHGEQLLWRVHSLLGCYDMINSGCETIMKGHGESSLRFCKKSSDKNINMYRIQRLSRKQPMKISHCEDLDFF